MNQKNFATDGIILTGIYGNDSTITFQNIEGSGKPQWVSFYYQSSFLIFTPYPVDFLSDRLLDIDDMGFGDQRKWTRLWNWGATGSNITYSRRNTRQNRRLMATTPDQQRCR